MSHISANNIDRELIIVSMSKFSESRNPNVASVDDVSRVDKKVGCQSKVCGIDARFHS